MSKIRPFSAATLAEALPILMRGGVLIVPTDTVYGLVCHPDFPEALARIRQMKSRDQDKPFQLLAASTEQVRRMGALQSPLAERYAAFWPGALTLVLETAEGTTEGFRVPAEALLCDLLARCGGYLRATSVNVSGEPPATSLEEVPKHILDAVDLILDGGKLPMGVASSVIRVTPEGRATQLRAGAVPLLPED